MSEPRTADPTPVAGEPPWWSWDTEDDDSWLAEFSGEDVRALVRERNRLRAEARRLTVERLNDERGHTHRHPTGSPFYHDECDITDAPEREAATPPLDVAEVIDALDAQAQLLACYRVGKHPSGKLLDRVGRANDLRTRLAHPEGERSGE